MTDKTILVVKETKAFETRVALIPKDANTLIINGYKVIVESGAGVLSSFSDNDYKSYGCEIRALETGDYASYKKLFTNIDIILRAKRSNREREKLENQVIAPKTIMIGALDPLERDSTHIAEYKKAGIIPYSIDQISSNLDSSMNILTVMSKFAGMLAVRDAINKFNGTPKNITIIGFGTVGESAMHEALLQGLNVTVIGGESATKVKSNLKINVVYLDKGLEISKQQQIVKNIVVNTDIVISSARQANTIAPILIPKETLEFMQNGSVVVDMALSEGGNVYGSKHDETILLGNSILVTNVSGYPKAMPKEASIAWSEVSLKFIMQLTNKH